MADGEYTGNACNRTAGELSRARRLTRRISVSQNLKLHKQYLADGNAQYAMSFVEWKRKLPKKRKKKKKTNKEKRDLARKSQQLKNYEILEKEGIAGAIKILAKANLWGKFQDVVYGLIQRYAEGKPLSDSQQEVLLQAARRQPFNSGSFKRKDDTLRGVPSTDPGVLFALEKYSDET